jgi:hypothetical protein
MSTTHRPKDDQNYWNIIFSVFFFCVVVVALWRLYSNFNTFPDGIAVFDAILLAFAAFRLTRLVVYDKITRFFREWFVEARDITHEGKTYVELRPIGHGFKHTIHDLLNCPWCVGLWAGLIVSYVYFMYPWGWFVILFLAISGVGSLLQLWANSMGWRAENLKLDAYTKEESGARSDRSGL